MSVWDIQFLDANGKKFSVINHNGANFTELVNGIGFFKLVVDNSSVNFARFVDYQKSNVNGVEQGLIYFVNSDGFVEFKGKVDRLETNADGDLILRGDSTLDFSTMVNLAAQNRVAETNGTRITWVLSDGSIGVDQFYGLTNGTIDAFSGNNLGALYVENQSAYQLLKQIVQVECDQDFYTLYNSSVGGNDTFEVRNGAGTSTVFSYWSEGRDLKNVVFRKDSRAVINRVTVQGTVINGAVIEVTRNDATSETKYGTRHLRVLNRNIEDTVSGNDYGDSIIANRKDPPIVLTCIHNDFSMNAVDPDTVGRTPGQFALGDKVNINAPSANIIQDMRIIEYSRKFVPKGTNQLSFKFIEADLRYEGLAVAPSSLNRNGTSSATPGQNLTQSTHTPGQNSSQNTHTPGQNFTQADAGGSSSSLNTTQSGSFETWTRSSSFSTLDSFSTGATENAFAILHINLWHATVGVHHVYDLRVYDGTNYYPNTTGFRVQVPPVDTGKACLTILVHRSVPSKTITIQCIDIDTTGGDLRFNYQWNRQGEHGHSISDKTNQATTATFSDITNQSTTANITDSSNQATSHPGSAG